MSVPGIGTLVRFQTVKDVGHLLRLYALLQAPEVLTQALQRSAAQLAEQPAWGMPSQP